MAPTCSTSADGLPTSLANGRFSIEGKLGQGCFGQVLIGREQETGTEIAVKFEELLSGFLDYEITVLKKLQQEGAERTQGFARLLYHGIEGCGSHRCLVMERLGRNLAQCMQAVGGCLAPVTVVLVAQQSIACLEYLHSKRIVHCDIKPENFVTGRGEFAHHLYLVDFGLSAEYHDGRSHLAQRELAEFRGNFRFASMSAHRCQSQGRRDDLEALSYMLIHLLTRSLPWSGASSADWRTRNKHILDLKKRTPPGELAAGLPPVFADFLFECREMAFAERPHYADLLDMFAAERERLSEESGVVIKDHDLQWIDKAELIAPVPIQRRVDLAQPDDRFMENMLKRATKKLTMTRFETSRAVHNKVTDWSGKTKQLTSVPRWGPSCVRGGRMQASEPDMFSRAPDDEIVSVRPT
mmetsp:Transcript_89440/g.286594  ORF Transcript_89440/g.286594 Transcript_89440/m.286594 type:complete len:411 (-) Transcript_89440:257-1489(-)